MEINCKQFRTNQFQGKFKFGLTLRIKIKVTDFSAHLILKSNQYKNANIANFVYYGKTQRDIFQWYFRLDIANFW